MSEEDKLDKIIKLLEEIKANQPIPHYPPVYYPPIVYYPTVNPPYQPNIQPHTSGGTL